MSVKQTLLERLESFLFLVGLYGYALTILPAMAGVIVFKQAWPIYTPTTFLLIFTLSILIMVGEEKWTRFSR